MFRRVGLLGWNGRQNAGDDAMTLAFCRQIRISFPCASISVYADQRYLSEDVWNERVTGLSFLNFAMRIPYVRQYVLRAIYNRWFIRKKGLDLLIIGGGSVFRNKHTMNHYARVCKLLKKRRYAARILALSVSVGPFETDADTRAYRALSGYLDKIVVRDSRSLELVRQFSPEVKCEFAMDAAMSCVPWLSDKTVAEIRPGTQKVIAVCLRAGEEVREQEKIVSYLSRLDTELYKIHFIGLSYNKKYDDGAWSKRMGAKLVGFDTTFTVYDGNLSHIINALQNSDIVIAVRLHALVFAVALGKPILYYAYQSKLNDLAKTIDEGWIKRIYEDTTLDEFDFLVHEAGLYQSSSNEGHIRNASNGLLNINNIFRE